MKKFCNIRLPVVFALMQCAGIIIGAIAYYYSVNPAWFAISALPAVCAVAVLLFLRKNLIKRLVFLLIAAGLFVGGAIASYFIPLQFDAMEAEENIIYSIHGTVTEKGDTSAGEYIILRDLSLDGRKISGKMKVYLSPTYGEWCDVGYSVDFDTTLDLNRAFEYGTLNKNVEDGIKYSATVYSGLHSTYGFSLGGAIRGKIKTTLFDNLDKETAAVAYAMLLGNTQNIDDLTLDSFRYGGVAHIFAVSGLHIGIIFSIISFITSRLLGNKFSGKAIPLLITFLYTALCGFPLSAVRAFIMCTVTALASLSHRQYDGLNSLAAAVIIMLCINPYSLFSIGFRLSVCAVGGIFTCSAFFEGLLDKLKLPDKVRSAISFSFGAQLGTAPVMLTGFGYLSGAGLLLNIIVMPVLSMAFSLIFIATFIGLIIPPAGILLTYAALPLEFALSVFIGAGFEKSLISGFGAGIFVLLYFIAILFLSDKFNITVLQRLTGIALSVAILASCVLIQYHTPFTGYDVIISSYGNRGEVLIKSNGGNILIVSDNPNYSAVFGFLNQNYAPDVDAIIIVGEDSVAAYAQLYTLCGNIYVWDDNLHAQPYGNIKINYVNDFAICGVDFGFCDCGSVVADINGIKFGITTEKSTSIDKCDIYIGRYPNLTVHCGAEIYFGNRYGSLNTFDMGQIIFNVIGNNYSLKSKLPPGR